MSWVDPSLFITVISVFGPKAVSDEEIYIRLPGHSCDDAPPCPDDRTCIMEEPKCYSRRCDNEPVPTCAYKHPYWKTNLV